jgi:hypothetical protein
MSLRVARLPRWYGIAETRCWQRGAAQWRSGLSWRWRGTSSLLSCVVVCSVRGLVVGE